MTPVAEEFSKAIEKERGWETMVKEKTPGSKDMFETYEKIARSSGKSRGIMKPVNVGFKALGWAGVIWGVVSGVREVIRAPKGQKMNVATEEAAAFGGSIAGSIVGSITALAILGFAAGLLGVATPVGWIAFGAVFVGSIIGGYLVSKTARNISK